MSGGHIAGIVLAGGKARRFAGGQKEEALLQGAKLIDHVIARARRQVGILAVSRADANSPLIEGVPSVSDIYPECGPLGGLHAGLFWARSLSPLPQYLATFACDTPLFAEDLVPRLLDEVIASKGAAAIAASGGDLHPTLGLWSIELEPLARRRLEAGDRSLKGFAIAADAVVAEFEDPSETAFFNVNSREDLVALEARINPSKRK